MANKSDQLIQEFLSNVTKLADDLRSAIIEEAQAAFAGLAGATPQLRGKRGPKASKSVGKVRGKRTAEQIEAQATQIFNYIKKNPASGAEQIGAALGMSTGEMALPIKALLGKRTLKTQGQKRGTKYTAK